MLSGAAIPPVDVLLCGAGFEYAKKDRPIEARSAAAVVRATSRGAPGFSAALGVDIFDELEIADGGDVGIHEPEAPAALAAITERARIIAQSGVVPGFVGTDATVTLAALRGIQRAKRKPSGLVRIAARTATIGGGATPSSDNIVRLALEEGLIRPDGVIQIGLRGPYADPAELRFGFHYGFEIAKVDDVRWDVHSVVSQLRRVAQRGTTYVSVDLGVLDPAHAPGVSAPSPGGITTSDLQQFLRALVGSDISGFDVTGLNPDLDVGGATARVATQVVLEVLAALADTRRSARPAPSSGGRGKRLSP